MTYSSANGDFVAWIFAFILLLASTLYAVARCRTPAAVFVFVSAVVARVALCALSAYELFLPADADRLDFHIQASQLATSGDASPDFIVGHQVYAVALSVFYGAFGTSIFLGSILSIVPYALSQVMLVKLLRLFSLEKYETASLAIFGFAPAMLLYANFTYREPTQIFCLMAALYYGLLFRRSSQLSSVVYCVMALAVFGILHSKFVIVVPLILLLLFFWPGAPATTQSRALRSKFHLMMLLVGSLSISLAFFGVLALSETNSLVNTLSSGNVTEYMLDTNRAVQGIAPRTMLPFQIESDSVFELIYKLPLILFQYTFAPILPFLVQEPQDLIALLDAIVRAVLLVFAVRFVRRSPQAVRSEMILLLMVFGLFSIVASLGTAAVGTAIRHQIKISWVLILFGVPGALASVTRLLMGRQAHHSR